MGKQRWTDTDKWDDDWYLDLPPVMKCVWEYLRDNCDGGTGFMKVSFRKMSRDINGEVTREEFNRHIADRVHWIDEDNLWIPAFIQAQFKNLSHKNKAHVNMAKQVVARVHREQTSARAAKYFDTLANLIRLSEMIEGPSIDPQETVEGESEDPHRIKDKGYRIRSSSEGGVGETKAREFAKAIYARYPRKLGKADGVKRLVAKIKGGLDPTELDGALDRFLSHHKAKGTESDYLPYFSSWVGDLETWLDQEAGKSECFAVNGPAEESFAEYLARKERGDA